MGSNKDLRFMIFIFLFLNCLFAAAQDNIPLTFKDGNKVVRLEFDNKLPYLELDRPTEIKVHLENVNLKESAIVGLGIRVVPGPNRNDYFTCTVTVVQKAVVDGHYKILVRYGYTEKNETKFCTFLIPVKR